MGERTKPIGVAAMAIALGLIAAVSGCAQAQDEQSPQEIIDAWAEIACVGADDFRTNPGEGDAVISAACTLPDETSLAMSMSQRRQYIEVYESESAVDTKIASVDCGNGTLRVTGPNWYAPTLIREIATGLQDEMGGSLAC